MDRWTVYKEELSSGYGVNVGDDLDLPDHTINGLDLQTATLIAAAPEMLIALKKARALLRQMTISEVFALGAEAIDAVGLSRWCINEGRATGSEYIPMHWLSDAIESAEVLVEPEALDGED